MVIVFKLFLGPPTSISSRGKKSKEKKQQLKENFYPWIFGTPQSRLVILFGSGRQILFKCGQGHRRRSLQSNLADKSQRWCTRFGRPAQLICCFQVDFVMEFDIAVRQVVVIQQHWQPLLLWGAFVPYPVAIDISYHWCCSVWVTVFVSITFLCIFSLQYPCMWLNSLNIRYLLLSNLCLSDAQTLHC